jgi:hypothetical protein
VVSREGNHEKCDFVIEYEPRLTLVVGRLRFPQDRFTRESHVDFELLELGHGLEQRPHAIDGHLVARNLLTRFVRQLKQRV